MQQILYVVNNNIYVITHTHTRLTALCPGLPGWAGTRKVKPIWILLKQETLSGSGISWAICKSASRSRQITMPAPHCSVFTGRMPFLPPNQQRQSTEGNYLRHQYIVFLNLKHTKQQQNMLFPTWRQFQAEKIRKESEKDHTVATQEIWIHVLYINKYLADNDVHNYCHCPHNMPCTVYETVQCPSS